MVYDRPPAPPAVHGDPANRGGCWATYAYSVPFSTAVSPSGAVETDDLDGLPGLGAERLGHHLDAG